MLAQQFHLAGHHEGAGASDFLDVGRGGEVDLDALAGGVNGRLTESDLEAELHAFMGFEPHPLVAVDDFDRLEDADETLGRSLLFQAGRLQQIDEGARRAIQDGHFAGSDVDLCVVDAQPGQGGHQVFDGVDADLQPRAFNIRRQRGVEPRIGDAMGKRRQLDDRIEVHPTKDDTGVDRTRLDVEGNPLPRMQADTDGLHRSTQGSLSQHLPTPSVLGPASWPEGIQGQAFMAMGSWPFIHGRHGHDHPAMTAAGRGPWPWRAGQVPGALRTPGTAHDGRCPGSTRRFSDCAGRRSGPGRTISRPGDAGRQECPDARHPSGTWR